MADPTAGERRRAFVIAGGGLVLVAALFLVTRVIGGDDGDVSAPVTVPGTEPGAEPGRPEAEQPGAVAAPEVGVIPDVPESFEIVELRDPFLAPLSALGEAPPAGPEAPARLQVRLTNTFNDPATGAPMADVVVDGQSYRVGEGGRFGPNGSLLAVSINVSARCMDFVRGDERITVCVGDERLIK